MNGGVLALVLMTSVAAAEPATTARLDASGACELATLEARTYELLGRPGLAPDARARIEVVSAQDGDRVTAQLTFSDDSGAAQPSRSIAAASCDELIESIAIVMSLVLRQPVPEPQPAPPPPSPPAPTVREVDTTYAPAPVLATATSVELGAMFGSSLESALVLGGRLERRSLAFGVDLALAKPTRVEVGAGAVHITSARLAAAGCARAGRLSGCGLVIGGLVRGTGEDLMDARSGVSPLVGVGGRVEWRQLMSRRMGVRVFGAVEQLVAKPSFIVGSSPVFTSSERQAWLGAGIFLHMP